jgi:hypothetical protein
MRFKSLKDFTLGKPKEKPGDRPAEEDPTRPISPTEEKMNGHTGDPEEMAQKIEGLTSNSDGDRDSGPHGPIGELSVEPEDREDDEITGIDAPEAEAESQEQVKLVEVSADKEPEPAAEPTPASADPANPLSGLFTDEDEEDNPLANLIRSLPDYTTHEIMEDLSELKRIIHEWQRE